jgi:hypothetical protein
VLVDVTFVIYFFLGGGGHIKKEKKKEKIQKNQKILEENKINISVRRVYQNIQKFLKIGRGRSNIQD